MLDSEVVDQLNVSSLQLHRKAVLDGSEMDHV